MHTGPKLAGREVWQHLLAGNQRFIQGRTQARDLPELRRLLAQGQQPQAAVLCCSDSRVPPELIFDQGLGDLFVVRTAGLVLDPTSLGSLEYGVAHLLVPLLLILGPESCGAVTAAVAHPEAREGHIGAIIEQISPAVAQAQPTGKTDPDLVEAATGFHLQYLAETLHRKNPIIREAVEAGRLEVVVAKYFLHAGQVQLLSSTF
jgi:carbonic anhydrase